MAITCLTLSSSNIVCTSSSLACAKANGMQSKKERNYRQFESHHLHYALFGNSLLINPFFISFSWISFCMSYFFHILWACHQHVDCLGVWLQDWGGAVHSITSIGTRWFLVHVHLDNLCWWMAILIKRYLGSWTRQWKESHSCCSVASTANTGCTLHCFPLPTFTLVCI